MRREQVSPLEYNAYYKNYIEQIALESELIVSLKEGKLATMRFFENIPESKWNYRYAEGKWTPKEVLLHLIDTERIFAYRALRFSRNDTTSLPGFDQDNYVLHSHADGRHFSSLLDEYAATRNATILMFENLTKEMLQYIGTASGSSMSPRAAGFIVCGHEVHHCTILAERYLH